MALTQDLSVGTVAGIIAAAVFIVNFTVPIIVPLITVGWVKNENSAATWSVLGRTLHSSHWPRILRTDSANNGEVNRTVRFASAAQTLLLLLIAVASIVTPLGLHEAIVPLSGLREQTFSYARDNSSMGEGTLPRRNDFGFSRTCWSFRPRACPWSATVINESINETTYSADLPDGYDIRIPKNITEIYTAGLSKLPKTVSSVFDIQWRTYKKVLQTRLQKEGQSYLVGDYRQLSQMVLDNAWRAIDGLVVNTKTGGIGFRNHTTPPPLPYGGLWTEDLLFIEPETECVDLNITLDFKIPYSNDELYQVVDLAITDHGGFANFVKEIPEIDTANAWESPNLRQRAYFAAWFSNAYSMMYMNVTNLKNKDYPERFMYVNAKEGQQFAVNNGKNMAFKVRPDQMTLSKFGGFLNIPEMSFNGTLANSSYANPFKMSATNFTDIPVACSNNFGTSYANISNVAVSCGMVYGAARRKDGSRSFLFDPGTEWTVPLYSCASASRASIKAVSFRYNGTQGLNSLSIEDIKDKTYAKDEDKPLWAVENLKMRLDDVNPIWGFTTSEHENHPNISTSRSDHLYLPGRASTLYAAPTQAKQSLAGVDFYSMIMSFTYSLDAADAGDTYGVPDYTGRSNLALFNKWQDLSSNGTTAASIIDLIWTDISANAVIGTKSQLPSEQLQGLAKRNEPTTTAQVPITLYARKVQFHLPYGIPAFLVLALCSILALIALGGMVCGKSTPATMRRFLDQTSTGRILTTFLYTNECPPNSTRNNWLQTVGKKNIHLGGTYPRAMDPSTGTPLAPGCCAVLAVAPPTANSEPYGKMNETNISLHSLPSPQPYSPVNAGSALSYFNPLHEDVSRQNLLPQGPPSPHVGGYQEYRADNLGHKMMSPLAADRCV